MAETLLFAVAAPAADEDPAVNIHWYQSVDGLVWGETPIESAAIGSLAIDAIKEKYIFPSASADPAKYSQLKTESASGIFSPFGAIVPPRPGGANMCTIVADVVTFGVEPKAGIGFSLAIKTKTLNGYLVDAAATKKATDADGRVTFDVMAGGVYELVSTIIGKPIEIDTAGQVIVNVADVIAPP